MRLRTPISACGVMLAALTGYTWTAVANSYGDWLPASRIEIADGSHPELNTPANEGCPTISRDGSRLYFASNRAGGYGGIDIWVSTRGSEDEPWGEPFNLGATINTTANEFCPSPMRNGKGFLFISNKSGGCGGGDMYVTREHATHGWAEPQNLGCHINSPAEEASPFLVEYDSGTVELYFSSTRPGGFDATDIAASSGDSDLYVAVVGPNDVPAPAELVPDLNTAFDDARPNVRRDGLEIVFDSNRPGGLGAFDLWSASRDSAVDPWSSATNLGSFVNSAAAETRASLSWNAAKLYFGSTRPGEGASDIYVTTRER